jgi:hypothetical protein
MGKQRYTTEEIIHKLGEGDVLIGRGQTVIPRPLRRRLYGFRSKTSCRLNDIRDALRGDCATRLQHLELRKWPLNADVSAMTGLPPQACPR